MHPAPPRSSEEVGLTEMIERIGAVDPAGAQRARASLESVLAPVRESAWPEVAWRFSRLTGDGSPVELAFTSDGDLRYTAEVAGPEVADHARLDAAVAAAAHSGCPIGSEAVDRLRALQRGAPLRWGAWLSMRHGTAGDRAKVYAETPDSTRAEELVPGAAVCRRLRRHIGGQVRMVGVDSGGRIELYVMSPGLGVRGVDALARAVGAGDGVHHLLAVVESASRQPVRRLLKGAQLGWSVTLAPDGAPLGVALLVTARALCGGERCIRPALLNTAGDLGWDLTRYAAASAPLASGVSRGNVHGIAAFGMVPSRPIAFQIGLRPFG
jgi:hypothetical protein